MDSRLSVTFSCVHISRWQNQIKLVQAPNFPVQCWSGVLINSKTEVKPVAMIEE
ncbi:hypothetical protein XENTR_v10024193 [Xenopus tropicalis]|nr:hypothetical protein XENTR_v10024193 [Xenopus tropicalis]